MDARTTTGQGVDRWHSSGRSAPAPVRDRAEVICRRYTPGEPARALLEDDPDAEAFLDRLLEANLEPDAVEFLAHRLPVREAVWWGCLCAWRREEWPEPAMEALGAAVRWVCEPTEAHRRAAGEIGESLGCGTLAGCIALAAFWSGGSMAPEGLPEVEAPPGLTARTLVAGLRLESLEHAPTLPDEVLRTFVRLGREVAAGENRWV